MFTFFKPKKKTPSTELNKKLINSGKLKPKNNNHYIYFYFY